MTALAGYLGLEKSTITGLVDRAERRGLVRRAPSASDGRAVRVSFTADGHRLASQLTAEISGLLAPLIDGLTPADQHRLSALLGKVLG